MTLLNEKIQKLQTDTKYLAGQQKLMEEDQKEMEGSLSIMQNIKTTCLQPGISYAMDKQETITPNKTLLH